MQLSKSDREALSALAELISECIRIAYEKSRFTKGTLDANCQPHYQSQLDGGKKGIDEFIDLFLSEMSNTGSQVTDSSEKSKVIFLNPANLKKSYV